MTTFLAVAGPRLAFDIAHHRGLVGRIHIGRLRLEFGGAGVDAFETGRRQGCGDARRARRFRSSPGQVGQTRIGKAHHLELKARSLRLRSLADRFANPFFGLDDFADAGQEPRVEHGDAMDVVIAQPVPHRLRDDAQPVGGLPAERLGDRDLGIRPSPRPPARGGGRPTFARDFDLVKAGQPGSIEASAFCSDSWMVRPIAIASPTDFIAVVSSGVEPGNFSKANFGILVTT